MTIEHMTVAGFSLRQSWIKQQGTDVDLRDDIDGVMEAISNYGWDAVSEIHTEITSKPNQGRLFIPSGEPALQNTADNIFDSLNDAIKYANDGKDIEISPDDITRFSNIHIWSHYPEKFLEKIDQYSSCVVLRSVSQTQFDAIEDVMLDLRDARQGEPFDNIALIQRTPQAPKIVMTKHVVPLAARDFVRSTLLEYGGIGSAFHHGVTARPMTNKLHRSPGAP